MLYVENPKDAIRKSLEVEVCTNKLDKVVGEKINTQKSVTHLYMNNNRSNGEIKETTHLPLHKKE